MFGKESCPDCSRLKKFFSDSAIEYEYHDFEKEPQSREWVIGISHVIPVVILPNGDLLYSPSNYDLRKALNTLSGSGLDTPEEQIFDVVIVGAGPSGITAAIYAVRKNLKVLLISKTVGGQAVFTEDIENYPGFTLITGEELAQKFHDELDKFKGEGLWVKEGVEVTQIEGVEGDFKVKTDTLEYRCRNLIIASGRDPKRLGVPGEDKLFGRGVSTCATCDAPFYKGKDVVVVGGGNSALDSAYTIMKVAKSVKIISLQESSTIDEVLKEKLRISSNVEILTKSTVTEIKGESHVEGVVIKNVDSGETADLRCDGVFIEIGWVPETSFITQIEKDEQGRIKVDTECRTSAPGIWACGDVNNLWGEQIVIAAGEGSKAALSLADHLAKKA